MKRIAIVLAIFISLSFCLTVHASEWGFTTSEYEKKDSLMSTFGLSRVESMPRNYDLVCLDVRDDGTIALGMQSSIDSTKKTVVILSPDGSFEYGMTFQNYGSYGLQWDDERIVLCLVRSDLAVWVDSSCQITDIRNIDDTPENSAHWRKYIDLNERVVNGKTYVIKNDMGFLNVFSTAYSQLQVTDAEGNVTLIYENNTSYLVRTILVLVLVLSIVIYFPFYLINRIKKNKREATLRQSRME